MKRIHEEVLRPVKEQLLSPEALQRARKKLPKILAERRRAPDKDKIQVRLAEVEEQIGNLVEFIKRGVSGAVRSEIRKLEREQSESQAQLAKKDDHRQVAKMLPKFIDRYTEMIDDLEANLTQPHVNRARNALKKLGLTDIILHGAGDHLVAKRRRNICMRAAAVPEDC